MNSQILTSFNLSYSNLQDFMLPRDDEHNMKNECTYTSHHGSHNIDVALTDVKQLFKARKPIAIGASDGHSMIVLAPNPIYLIPSLVQSNTNLIKLSTLMLIEMMYQTSLSMYQTSLIILVTLSGPLNTFSPRYWMNMLP